MKFAVGLVVGVAVTVVGTILSHYLWRWIERRRLTRRPNTTASVEQLAEAQRLRSETSRRTAYYAAEIGHCLSHLAHDNDVSALASYAERSMDLCKEFRAFTRETISVTGSEYVAAVSDVTDDVIPFLRSVRARVDLGVEPGVINEQGMQEYARWLATPLTPEGFNLVRAPRRRFRRTRH